MVVGPEKAPAVVTLGAADVLFSGEWAGIEFHGPSTVLESLRAEPEVFMQLHSRITRGLPTDFGPDGEGRTIFEGTLASAPGSEENAPQQVKVKVILQEMSAGVVGSAPPTIAPELLSACSAEYALLSAPFAYYFQESQIVALYGLIPLMGSSNVRNVTPRGVFLLYDCSSGEKVWESYVGVASSAGLGKESVKPLTHASRRSMTRG
jgi:hypothetical protein